MGNKGEVLVSSYTLGTLSFSKLKEFQGGITDDAKQDYVWISKAMTFGYDNIYNKIKRFKITLAKTYASESDIPSVGLWINSAPFADSFTQIMGKAEDNKTLKFEIPREARKCKSFQLMITGKVEIEAIGIIYNVKGIK